LTAELMVENNEEHLPRGAREPLIHLDKLRALSLVTEDEYAERRRSIIDRATRAESRVVEAPPRRWRPWLVGCGAIVLLLGAVALGVVAIQRAATSPPACVDRLVGGLGEVHPPNAVAVKAVLEHQRSTGCDVASLSAAERAQLEQQVAPEVRAVLPPPTPTAARR
jgi:hypothetical protein